MQPKNKIPEIVQKNKLTPELFDQYSPAVYGKILSIVNKEPIAEKMLEKVFVSAYTNDPSFPLRSPMLSLIDLAHERTNKTLKAIMIFNECCSGVSVSINEKKA